jgi:hypothetical protein
MSDPDHVVQDILEYLEARIDPETIERNSLRHRAALNYEAVDRLPLSLYVTYEGERFSPYPYPEAFENPAKMMVNELLTGFSSMVHLVDIGSDTPLGMRSNLGVTIIASIFGAKIELRGDQMPWVRHFESIDRIREIAESPLPDLFTSLLPRALEQYAYFTEMLTRYPKCQSAIQLNLPDLQGPFDIAELLWGSDIFLAFYEAPDLLTAFLGKITEAILAAYKAISPMVKEDIRPDYQYQQATAVKGKILLRSDTIIMVSPDMYRRYVMPHDVHIAEELGGVGIHFCGNGQHLIRTLLDMPGMQCIDFGQADMMDLDTIYAQAAQCKVALARMRVPASELTVAETLSRFPTGVNLVCEPTSVAEAKTFWNNYIGGTE